MSAREARKNIFNKGFMQLAADATEREGLEALFDELQSLPKKPELYTPLAMRTLPKKGSLQHKERTKMLRARGLTGITPHQLQALEDASIVVHTEPRTRKAKNAIEKAPALFAINSNPFENDSLHDLIGISLDAEETSKNEYSKMLRTKDRAKQAKHMARMIVAGEINRRFTPNARREHGVFQITPGEEIQKQIKAKLRFGDVLKAGSERTRDTNRQIRAINKAYGRLARKPGRPINKMPLKELEIPVFQQ
jgi:hypothetical protein